MVVGEIGVWMLLLFCLLLLFEYVVLVVGLFGVVLLFVLVCFVVVCVFVLFRLNLVLSFVVCLLLFVILEIDVVLCELFIVVDVWWLVDVGNFDEVECVVLEIVNLCVFEVDMFYLFGLIVDVCGC